MYFQYGGAGKEIERQVQYKVAGTQIADFGRVLMQGELTHLLTDSTDIQPARDGKYIFKTFRFAKKSWERGKLTIPHVTDTILPPTSFARTQAKCCQNIEGLRHCCESRIEWTKFRRCL